MAASEQEAMQDPVRWAEKMLSDAQIAYRSAYRCGGQIKQLAKELLDEASNALIQARLAAGLPAVNPPKPPTGRAPVCAHCGDTHTVSSGPGLAWPCTHCPTPCRKCKGAGTYCATTPCACECHGKAGGR
jgi:hypothetical protein